MATRKNAKDHRQKKNPRSAEAYQAEREKRNGSRGKQVWVPKAIVRIHDEEIVEDGHWERV